MTFDGKTDSADLDAWKRNFGERIVISEKADRDEAASPAAIAD